jgi:transposase-like protein
MPRGSAAAALRVRLCLKIGRCQAGVLRTHRQSARREGVNESSLGNWVELDLQAQDGTSGLSTGDVAELKRLRAGNAELRTERDVLRRSVVLWWRRRGSVNPNGHPVRGPRGTFLADQSHAEYQQSAVVLHMV